MKTKKGFEMKLVLKKRTITDLNNKELHEVVGGATTGLTVCITICASICPPCPTVKWC
jgi:hypothetical protein